MFGVYHFAGIVESGFAMLILLLLVVQRAGYLRGVVNENHFHNLGIWLIAAATFWAYIWFCQFMLIWYSNIPEETAHYFARMNTPWFWVTFVLNPLLNWALVFLILLPRPNKRNKKMLAIAACIALLGRWVDLWQFSTPGTHLNKAGMPEVKWLPYETFWLIGMAVGTVGLFVFVTLKMLEKAPLLAKKDPYFEESLHHHL
jgi:Ni/Fe-hydrogenase subunit HybB-like protein